MFKQLRPEWTIGVFDQLLGWKNNQFLKIQTTVDTCSFFHMTLRHWRIRDLDGGGGGDGPRHKKMIFDTTAAVYTFNERRDSVQ